MREKKCHQESHKSGKRGALIQERSKEMRLTPTGNDNHYQSLGVHVIQLSIAIKTYFLVLVLAMLYLIESQGSNINLETILLMFKVIVWIGIIEFAYLLYIIIVIVINKYKK